MNINLEQAVAEFTIMGRRGLLDPHSMNFEQDVRGVLMRNRLPSPPPQEVIESPFMDVLRRQDARQKLFLVVITSLAALICGLIWHHYCK